jgi:hypothetical protein
MISSSFTLYLLVRNYNTPAIPEGMLDLPNPASCSNIPYLNSHPFPVNYLIDPEVPPIT